MLIEVHLTTEPVPRPYEFSGETTLTGARVEFYGIVRAEEQGMAIKGLKYEIYPSMARSEIERILKELARDHPCQAAAVCHRHGFIPVGEATIYVGIAAQHRAEAFSLLSAFMDRLKQEVPIWKVEAVPC